MAGLAELQCVRNIGRYSGRHIGMDADQFRGRLQRHLLRNYIPQSPPCATDRI
jgi:hypothetical protein